jgi:predicted dehydrogenase
MIRVAVVGAGRWGINHVRAFARIETAEVTAVCDASDEALARAKKLVPGARLEKSFDAVLAAPDVDAVVLATPAPAHAAMAIQALRAKKHVLVEKPLALSAADAVAVTDAAKSEGRVLMVGHLLLFHPAVRRMKEALTSGEIGDILYMYAVRVNLGTLRRDENAMWSLAPHDISVMLHLLGKEPVDVAARGAACLQPGVQDVVFVSLRFPGGVIGQIQNSWLDPRKERRIVVVGSKKMMEFDDVHPTDKLKIHDKGYDREPAFAEYTEFLNIRSGEVRTVDVPMAEPLDAECRHFLECVAEGKQPLTDGPSAVRVVKVLEAAQRSMMADGVPAAIEG